MKKNKIICILSILAVCFVLTGVCFADEGVKAAPAQAASSTESAPAEQCDNPCWLKGVEFLTGFSKANLKNSKAYETIPLIIDLNFDLKPLVKKIGVNYWGPFQFLLEPSISPVIKPNATNVEFGTGFILKIGLLPEGSKIQPYIKAGPGLLYTTQHTKEQGTKFNFFEYAGGGVHYFVNKNTAFTIEGRYRHFSNCGIKDPNHGVNSYFALVGVAYQY